MSLPIFPSLPGLAYPVKRTVKWNGNKFDSLSGKRVRTSYQAYPTYAYDLRFEFLRSDSVRLELQQLLGFINSVQGGTGVWLYGDPDDNSAAAQQFGIGDGLTATFQLVRTFGSFTEPIFFPNLITNIAVNGSPTSAYTLGNLGQVTFTTAPALGVLLTWTGTFYWGCRFDDDVFDFEKFMLTLYETKSLKFSTEKLR